MIPRTLPACDHTVIAARLAEDHPGSWLRALYSVILAAGVRERRRWHFPGGDLRSPLDRTVGLPIGNLTSQLWANRYLDPVDHLVQDRLRVRAYLRYMEDTRCCSMTTAARWSGSRAPSTKPAMRFACGSIRGR